jgi:hypothetical protein
MYSVERQRQSVLGCGEGEVFAILSGTELYCTNYSTVGSLTEDQTPKSREIFVHQQQNLIIYFKLSVRGTVISRFKVSVGLFIT